jgi:uncharacterized protein
MALTPEERHAITDLFARMQAQGPVEKDSEAEALINQLMRRTPDSAYMLVQTVLVEGAHIEDLEARVQDLEAQLAGGSRPASRGSFLGGARRTGASMARNDDADDRRSGIPPIGSRSGPSAYDAPPRGGPSWSGGREQAAAAGQPAQSGGGGFFRTAAAMAAGVAGGTLLANSLGGLFGGQKSGDAQAGQNGDANEASHQNAIDNDPGNYDADYHDAGVEEGDWGVGLDDLDI